MPDLPIACTLSEDALLARREGLMERIARRASAMTCSGSVAHDIFAALLRPVKAVGKALSDGVVESADRRPSSSRSCLERNASCVLVAADLTGKKGSATRQ